ncbi:ELOVL fatty acid elongase 8b isoform X1 [Oryzias melastigma]|uniref:ELOVL fatty acid elongase 8b isoform X1 n=1 Tax=Oryzias melastigma TaxID=30732 RepID=UPI00168D1E24|nr:ELOVL fatty acid elongase 8b isoform X1 [Oryzias melastigma]
MAAAVWNNVVSLHQRIVENGDKRTDPWLLVYSPVPVALIFLVYLCVIWAGPRLMKSREPVDLRVVLIVYNFAMVGLSAYMFHEFLVTSWLSDYSLLCQPVDYSTRPLPMRVQPPAHASPLRSGGLTSLLHPEKEEQPADLPARLPSRHHDLQLVGGGQVRGRRTVVLHRPGEHLRPRRHVLLLRPGGHRPPHAEVPVVEAVPDVPAADAVPALPAAHRLQPVHPLRLPRLHERRGLRLLRHPHHPLQQLLLPELPQQEEEEMRAGKTTCSVSCVQQRAEAARRHELFISSVKELL